MWFILGFFIVLALLLFSSGVYYIVNPSVFRFLTDRFTNDYRQSYLVGRVIGGILIALSLLVILFLIL